MGQVGRKHSGSSGPTSHPSRVIPDHSAQFCSQRVLEYFSVVGHTLQLWLWMKSTGRHTNFKMGLSMQTALHVLIFWVHNLGTLVLPPFDCS